MNEIVDLHQPGSFYYLTWIDLLKDQLHRLQTHREMFQAILQQPSPIFTGRKRDFMFHDYLGSECADFHQREFLADTPVGTRAEGLECVCLDERSVITTEGEGARDQSKGRWASKQAKV